MTDGTLKGKRSRLAAGRAGRTLAARIAATLREEIIAGRIAAGEKIVEQQTAVRLGVSRVPVREATILLEREGLLVRSETGRRRVRGLAAADLVEIAELRLLIEPRLAALAAERHTAADAAAIERNLAALAAAETGTRIALLDAAFHDLVAAAAHHSRLASVWEMNRGQMLLLIAAMQRHAPQLTPRVREGTVSNHRGLWELILARDAKAAATYIERCAADLLERTRALAPALAVQPTEVRRS